jgi:hypothetical protein
MFARGIAANRLAVSRWVVSVVLAIALLKSVRLPHNGRRTDAAQMHAAAMFELIEHRLLPLNQPSWRN